MLKSNKPGPSHGASQYFFSYNNNNLGGSVLCSLLIPDCPLSKIIPKKKETKYNLRNRTVYHPEINSDRFKKVVVSRLVFKYNI